MRWFQGGIGEAIAKAKNTHTIFVVFVEGKDDVSKGSAIVLNNEDISKKLENDFVAIKLDSESEAYKQFAQIYQLVPIPSLFFISPSGTPLEVVAGEMQVEDLKNKIETIHANFVENKTSPTTTTPPKMESSPELEENKNLPTTSEALADSAADSLNSPLEESMSTSDSDMNLSKEEKMERAKQLIEKKKQIKQEEEEKTQRQKEIERRVVGQEVQKLRRRQQDMEMKQAREEWQREKAEAAAAKEKILKQIEQDKAERARKKQLEQDEKEAQSNMEKLQKQQEAQQRASANCEFARLQFRLPDGVARTQQFSAITSLGEVRAWVKREVPMSFGDFVLSTSFPRREFPPSEDELNLQQLGLVPNAVLLILPASSASKSVTPAEPGYGGFLTRFFWNLMTPLINVFNYLRGFFSGRGGGNNVPTDQEREEERSEPGIQQPAKRARHDDSISEEHTKPRRRLFPGESRTVRRHGNVHGLSNAKDSSDDENNTWNGNSTQQM